jgi:hypothetical protein
MILIKKLLVKIMQKEWYCKKNDAIITMLKDEKKILVTRYP